MADKKMLVAFAGALAIGPALAQRDIPTPEVAAAIVEPITSANPDSRYRGLLNAEREDLIRSLASGAPALTQAMIDRARQPASLANAEWLDQSAYDFAVDDNQAAGVKLLSPFLTLPRATLVENDAIVAQINGAASPAQKEHALVDADAIAFLYVFAEALGPKLGPSFLRAYEKGAIAKAAALIKASEVSTGAAKAYFNYPRPSLIDGNKIELVPDAYVAKDNVPYHGGGGAFPSGHANAGYTDALLLAAMLPERFVALVDRAAQYGYSRVVLGVHYPLDVIGSRMIAERNIAHDFNDPRYRALFDQAREELRAALERECGESLATCAKPGDAESDPWTAPGLRAFYRFTMTYGLSQVATGDAVESVPSGAEVLLTALRPDLAAETRRDILKRTALASGFPLDSKNAQEGSWQRVNLHDAALDVLSR